LIIGVAGGTAAVGGATIGINSIGLIFLIYFILFFFFLLERKRGRCSWKYHRKGLKCERSQWKKIKF
jgi:hypothetical protein